MIRGGSYMKKTLEFNWKYGTEDVTIHVDYYSSNGKLYVGILTEEDGIEELFSDVTINIPSYDLAADEGFICGDISDELIEFIERYELGKVLPFTAKAGYSTYKAVKFDLDRLAEYDPDGVARYKKMVS